MEIEIKENKENKTTFRIDKYNVVFADYEIKEGPRPHFDEDEPIALFSMPHKAFELAIKVWDGFKR